jgi:hypothetical protein
VRGNFEPVSACRQTREPMRKKKSHKAIDAHSVLAPDKAIYASVSTRDSFFWASSNGVLPSEFWIAPSAPAASKDIVMSGFGLNPAASWRGCRQTNSNQSQFARTTVNLCGTKKAPLGKGRGAVELVVLS